jgi:DNA-binding transcriptional MerR regulator
MTSTDVRRKLGITEYQLNARLAQDVFPPPTRVDQQGVRYFDDDWLRAAQEIMEQWKGKRG